MPRLFMLLLGCTPQGRNIEQHDIFFGIADSINDLLQDVVAFWPDAHKLHLDAWREITQVNGHRVEVVPRNDGDQPPSFKLFFLNLGGYKKNEFEEYHYKMIVAAAQKGEAINLAKQTAFFRHTGFEGADSHIDDKYGIDVDDFYEIADILPARAKEKYKITVSSVQTEFPDDEFHLGYIKLSKLQDNSLII